MYHQTCLVVWAIALGALQSQVNSKPFAPNMYKKKIIQGCFDIKPRPGAIW